MLSGTFSSKEEARPTAGSGKHKRSVSIISIGANTTAPNEEGLARILESPLQLSAKRHGRAASIHGPHLRSESAATRFIGSSIAPSRALGLPMSKQKVISTLDPKQHPTAPISANADDLAISGPLSLRTVSTSSNLKPNQTTEDVEEASTAALAHKSREHTEARNIARWSPRLPPAGSDSGTPRSSTDFYSTNNDSSETLASEYIAPGFIRPPLRATHERQSLHPSTIIGQSQPPEVLMMGYVQLLGSFTLDGSLVNPAPFEVIKRKGVIGGQGSGGVVGVEPLKRDGGLLSALSWTSIGGSLNGLLGSPELSSIKEMKGIANAKSIPILATPQSILFVDMRLAPGESKSYIYRHRLPRGIPPSHKGRAMKVTYQLIIGLQRAQHTAQQQMIRQVEVPFKVLPGVNRMAYNVSLSLCYANSPQVTAISSVTI